MPGTRGIDDIKRLVKERGVKPPQAFFALFLAAAAETGVLNQGSVGFFAKYVAPRLRSYLEAMGVYSAEGGAEEKLKGIASSLNKALEISDEVRVEIEDNEARLVVNGKKCRYCPKGVGLAEIPGTACPFPRLFEEMAKLEGVPLKLEMRREGGRTIVVEKQGGYCIARYRIGER